MKNRDALREVIAGECLSRVRIVEVTEDHQVSVCGGHEHRGGSFEWGFASRLTLCHLPHSPSRWATILVRSGGSMRSLSRERAGEGCGDRVHRGRSGTRGRSHELAPQVVPDALVVRAQG
jgi:hypothetical protein